VTTGVLKLVLKEYLRILEDQKIYKNEFKTVTKTKRGGAHNGKKHGGQWGKARSDMGKGTVDSGKRHGGP
jgi:hypothetical protein